VEEVIGYLKEKSSTWIAQNVEREARNFLGHKLWARGYSVSRTPEMAGKLQLKLASHKVQSLVPESFITAFGGSHSNPQLCWGLLILSGHATRLSLERFAPAYWPHTRPQVGAGCCCM
jgi:hypothetical protein